MSSSELAAYLRTRLPASRFGPLAVGLVLAALAGGPAPGPGRLAWQAVLAASLLLQFRVWDDLADRERDRRRHPRRVLVTARSLGPFHALGGAAAGAGLLLLAAGPDPGRRLAVYGLLVLALALWYGAGRRRWSQPVLGYHVLLAKYPVFAYLLGGAPARPLPRLLAMLSLYLGLCVYEVLHDAEVARAPGARGALGAELAALVATAGFLALSLSWEVPA
jgi:4-hydroxybenzoate polyprenyltransferase